MDRHLRKVAKTDEFKETFWGGWEFLTHHTDQLKKYALIALGLLIVGVGIYFYTQHQAGVRAEALAQALKVDQATVGPQTSPNGLHFNTEDQKNEALVKAMSGVAAKYHGTQEGAIAQLTLAQNAVDHSNLAQAEKLYKDIADSAPAAYASQASLALADIYSSSGRDAEALKILDNLAKHPTVTVSKETVIIAQAKLKAKTDRDGARKMLEPLRMSRSGVSKAVVAALGDIDGHAN